MEKAKIYEELKEKIETYLCDNSFERDGDEYSDSVFVGFDLSGGIYAECSLSISGYDHEYRGDYDTPSSYGGEIDCEVYELCVYDENGEELFSETYVSELSTSIDY